MAMRWAPLLTMVLLASCGPAESGFEAAERDFRRSFTPGLRLNEVLHKLDSLAIGHSPFQTDSALVIAIVRDVESDAITRTDAQFRLVFDSSGVLLSVSAKRTVTGP